ncbi:putative Na+/H+ antiporter [Azovibrio restrictus]|uniref:putative Na+/H+ antiporter n=1 Tax=Azovibrio restrictus TaxID=146938 RepID=UPI0026E9A41F|nr:putative Na+/H+ antiporter [Azovibrio restrictus]MDD3484680.1 putative Na+/H+ antiporter [Azovibrio restrictus]
MNPSTIQIVGAILFAVAIIHTFSTKFFEHLAHTRPAHAGLWHLLGEVEAVFGFWAIVLVVFMGFAVSKDEAVGYLDSRNYTEPLFVFAIMVVAASKSILQFASGLVRMIANFVPLPRPVAIYFTIMAAVPLLGSFITEPAAMTLAALMLRELYFSKGISSKLMYVTIGTLFVNISIGGTLTSFAAPPVLMVAATWNWDSWYMLSHFGWKSAIAVLINAAAATLIFQKELRRISISAPASQGDVPALMVAIHILLLFLIVVFAHHPPVFLGVFLLFMGLATAYPKFQERLILREGLMVAFFLAGLVVLGGQQAWWLQPILVQMNATTVYFGATALTAITDNAALTYLGSLVEGLSEEFKYALVAGAVTGGGLTVIANAPNPAGMSILRGNFDEGSVNPLGLLISALPPTLVAILAFQLL